jgi:hypothetical protein
VLWIVALATLLSIGVGTLVGGRLLRLAVRTRKAPELAIGLALLVYAAFTQPAALAVGGAWDQLPFEARVAAFLAQYLGYQVTLWGLGVFTWVVFGLASRWRAALCGALGALGGIGLVFVFLDQWPTVVSGAPLESHVREATIGLAFALAFGWTAWESLHYRSRLRRRLALGLADPVVVNRFLVWGVGAALSTALLCALIVLTFFGMGVTSASPSAHLVVALAGLVNAGAWLLTFFPPEAYARRVRERANAS